jgi:pimeloyl-ACP methyl ester carboxylesterase
MTLAGSTSSLRMIQRVTGAGLELAYRVWNANVPGVPLVLLHGITASSEAWAATAVLIQDRPVIALDARGHGESDWDLAEDYSVDAHFADLATALDALHIDRCVLGGFSMGGGVAILAAACLPERIAALAVIDAYPHPEQSPGSAGIARWVAHDARRTRHFDPAIARRFREMLAADAVTRADLRTMWEAITCPTVVIRGAESTVLPEELASDMLRALPGSRLETIPGVGHGLPFAAPAALARVLRDHPEGRG